MLRRWLTVLLIFALLFGARTSPAIADEPVELPPPPASGQGTQAVLIELTASPAVEVYEASLRQPGRQGFTSAQIAVAASRNQIAINVAQQQQLGAQIQAAPYSATEIYRVNKVLNAIAAYVDPASIPAIKALRNVKDVHILEPDEIENSTSVPLIGVPAVWAGANLPGGATGTGIKIGIIDTGIDYQHAMFGGTGLLTDYQANNVLVVTDTISGSPIFPTARVVGGYDFAGNAYTGSNVPVPDPDPMDCQGHGTHVAGTAAGGGVKADGTSYTGPYDGTTPFGSLRLGPGVAPQAKLYALRVFGCTGSTNLVVQAIDWAIDPNGDSDFSDHLDVINMSLGSSQSSVSKASELASEKAALAGVLVVISAGNDRDAYFAHGTPGVATRPISVAASDDPGGRNLTALTITAPPGLAGIYVASTNAFTDPTPPAPPLPSGQTAAVVLAVPNDACSPLTNAAAVAGKIVIATSPSCLYVNKAQNAQAAGAIGLIVQNVVGAVPGTTMIGASTSEVTIPAVLIGATDGAAIVANLPGVTLTMEAPSSTSIASFSSRGPRGGPDFLLKPDITAPGVRIPSAQTGVTCTAGACQNPDASGFKPGNQVLTISGTSMAAPHVAGSMALLRQLHPDWSLEELKATIMNGAIKDVRMLPIPAASRVGPGRVGAGLVDLATSSTLDILAFNDERTGIVSLTFDPVVTAAMSEVKVVRVVNKGTVSRTFDLAVDSVVDGVGMSFTVGNPTVTIAAGQAVTIPVTFTADPAAMDHTRDSTVPSIVGTGHANYLDQARHWLSEEGAYLTFSQSGSTKLRVPLYAGLRPSSAMSGAASIATSGSPTGTTSIPLSGTGVCSGVLAAGPSCTGTFPTDEKSLVTPFELQVVSPRDPAIPAAGDLQNTGVAYYQAGGSPNVTNDLLMFGVSSYGDWINPNEVAYNICVDSDSDGVYDKAIINTNPSFFVPGSAAVDTYVRIIQDLVIGNYSILGLGGNVNLLGPNVVDSALMRSNTLIVAARPGILGMASVTPIRYKVVTCAGSNPGCARTLSGDRCSPAAGTFLDQAVGPYSWSPVSQGLNFGGVFLNDDQPGRAITVTWNTGNMTSTLGAMLIHHHNGAGARVQTLPLDTAQRADLGLALSASPGPVVGQIVTLAATVTNSGPNAATGVVVDVPVPTGLTYVSDDGGGAFVSSTGRWTIGGLANGASTTLNIVATVNTSDPIPVPAQVSNGGVPLDPSAANNTAKITLKAPRQGDLRIGAAASPGSLIAGQTAVYSVTVSNLSGDPAYNVSVATPFAGFPGITIAGSSAGAGMFDPVTKLWTISSLSSGITRTLILSVTAPAIGPIQLTATATSEISDSQGGNNSASATVNASGRATSTSVTAGPAPGPGAGLPITITVADIEVFGIPGAPTGVVTITGAPALGGSASCTLAGVSTTTSSCSASPQPGTGGDTLLSATYPGDASHLNSGGGAPITVMFGVFVASVLTQ